jgi:hypothetical protein
MQPVRAGQDRPEAARRVVLTGPGIPKGIMVRSWRCRLLGALSPTWLPVIPTPPELTSWTGVGCPRTSNDQRVRIGPQ